MLPGTRTDGLSWGVGRSRIESQSTFHSFAGQTHHTDCFRTRMWSNKTQLMMAGEYSFRWKRVQTEAFQKWGLSKDGGWEEFWSTMAEVMDRSFPGLRHSTAMSMWSYNHLWLLREPVAVLSTPWHKQECGPYFFNSNNDQWSDTIMNYSIHIRTVNLVIEK